MGFSRQEYWSGLPFPPPVDNVLSQLSTMTYPSWMALQRMAHSSLELCKPLCYDKAVIHKEDEPPRSEGVHYATGEEQRNSSRKNEEARPKWKGHSIVDVSGGKSKVRCCKEQYFIGTWNVRSTYQGEFDVVKQEMASMNINILGVSELK